MAWTCLVYNLFVCVQLVSGIGGEFFSLLNLLLFCALNGTTILATIIAYSKMSWLHAIGPLITLSQLGACLQAFMQDELDEKSIYLVQASAIMAYCLALFTMITKWAVQAPTIFLLSQLNFYLANSPGEQGEIFGVIL